jgi:hypothetical protein
MLYTYLFELHETKSHGMHSCTYDFRCLTSYLWHLFIWSHDLRSYHSIGAFIEYNESLSMSSLTCDLPGHNWQLSLPP